jgi:hypothetical protein
MTVSHLRTDAVGHHLPKHTTQPSNEQAATERNGRTLLCCSCDFLCLYPRLGGEPILCAVGGAASIPRLQHRAMIVGKTLWVYGCASQAACMGHACSEGQGH